jgi:hypothetical protein
MMVDLLAIIVTHTVSVVQSGGSIPLFSRRPFRSAPPENAFEASQRRPQTAAARSQRGRRSQDAAAACQSGAQRGFARSGQAAEDG